MPDRYYLQIEKKPGNWWEATLYKRTYNNSDLDLVELAGMLKTDQGYLSLLQMVSQEGWYDSLNNRYI